MANSGPKLSVWLMGLTVGLLVVLIGPEPTGSDAIDFVLLVVATTVAVGLGSTAPWWSHCALAGAATALASSWPVNVLGFAVLAGCLSAAARRQNSRLQGALTVGASILILCRARGFWVFGASTAVAAGFLILVVITAVIRTVPLSRRRWLFAGGSLIAVSVSAVVGLAAISPSINSALRDGDRAARQGLEQLRRGDFDLAEQSFAEAADSLDQADERLRSWPTRPATVIPVAAQHLRSARTLAASVRDAMRELETELSAVDLAALTIDHGRIDLDAIRSLGASVGSVVTTVDELQDSLADAGNPWLVTPFADRIEELSAEISGQRQFLDRTVNAIGQLPAMLGADRERVYFVMFTTPAEARGQGGFMGNYAELTVSDGEIAVTDFGRHDDLNRSGTRPRILRQAPADWLDRYASSGFRYGFDGIVGDDPWSNITISPDFPSTAHVVSELYPQSGGREIDGVLSLDVFALQRIIGLVGPIQADGVPVDLDGENSARYLLIDQYVNDDSDARVDALEEVAVETLQQLLSERPPSPLDLGRAMAPMIEQRRVLGWMRIDTEQTVMGAIAMTGGLLGSVRSDVDETGYAVTVVDDGGTKLDTYLERSITLDDDGGSDQLTIEVAHTADVDHLPSYVIGNTIGVPRGWLRLWLSVHTTETATSADLDGEPVALQIDREAGLNAYSVVVDVAPGSSTELTLTFAPKNGASSPAVVVQPQPLTRPESWTVYGADPRTVVQTTKFERPVSTSNDD